MNLVPPLGGLSDALSFDAQPRGTTPFALNASSIDPVTNRVRLCSRAGSEEYNSNPLGPGNRKVQALVQSISDNRRTTYTTETTASAGDLSEGDEVTPSATSTVDLVVDGFGNEWALDGPAALVRYNSVLNEVNRFSLPTKDDGQVCRALCIDPFGNVYVGVSEGGNQAQAWLAAFSPDDDLGLKQLWLRHTGAFVERLRWQDGYLYFIENDIEVNRAYYSLYSGADTATPVLAQRKDVTAPVGDFVVNSAGAVVTTHPPSLTRRLDPRYPDYGFVLDEQRWNPTMLPQFKDRIWVHLSAEDLKGQIQGLKDGDPITIWRDKYGSGRKLIADTAMSTAGTPQKFIAPKYIEKGPCGKPAVRFSGDRCRMISEMNPNAEQSMADLQRTLLPGYKGNGYLIVIVCKPSESAGIERLLGQWDSQTGGELKILINTNSGGGSDPGAIYTNQAGNGTGTSPSGAAGEGRFSNKTGMAIITSVSGNGHSWFNNTGGRDSAWRVNGWPLAHFGAQFTFFTDAGHSTWIGCNLNELAGFTGDITDIFVLRDYTEDGTGNKLIATYPYYDQTTVSAAYDASSDTEIERIEGYFAWKYGIPHMLDDGANAGWGVDGASSSYRHPFTSDTTAIASDPNPPQQGPPNATGSIGAGGDTKDIDLFSPDPLSAKWSPQRGNLQWTNVGPGQGYGIAVDSDDNLFTVGPLVSLAGATLNKWLDRGNSVTQAWWMGELNGGGNDRDYDYAHARLATDKYKNVYVPFHWTGAVDASSLVIYDTNGTSVLRYKVANSLFGYSVAIDPAIPDYGAQPITLPEFVYLTTKNNDIAAKPTVHKIRLVARAVTSGSVRDTSILGVCDGIVKRFTKGTGAPVTISSVPSGLSLDANALVCAFWSFGSVYFIDGTNYLQYSPVTDVLTKWESTSAGTMPANARWGCMWGGRAWLIRCPGDPANFHASAQGDPSNWDTNPATPVVTQAFEGNATEMGTFPDIPVSLIPWTREMMIVPCDHTIQLVYGNALAGGSITEVTSQTGGTFGPSWCIDDAGALYFFGSRGGVYRMTPSGGKPESISTNIQRRLMDIDLVANYVTLAWNSELDELWVQECPYGQGSAVTRRWRWQKTTNAWWEDTDALVGIQPTCFVTYDADSVDDRAFLWGDSTGRVRNWSRTAADDSGYPVDSQVVLGPFGISGRECRIGHPTVVLASEQSGANLEFYASETSDVRGDAFHRQALVGGRNQTLMRWLRGSRAWLKISSCAAGSRWALESGTLDIVDTGRTRVRS